MDYLLISQVASLIVVGIPVILLTKLIVAETLLFLGMCRILGVMHSNIFWFLSEMHA